MTLKEYILQLEKFVDENPKASDLRVVTSIDNEGNLHLPVTFKPTIGFYDSGVFDDFDPGVHIDVPNAVCVN